MITLTDLQKVVGQATVVDIAALQVNAGEIAALTGPVDSGKDVLLRLLTGAIRPTTGSVRLAGLDPYLEREAFSRRVGVLFSQDSLYRRMSVLQNLQFYCRLHRLPAARALEVLEQVGLADHARANVEKLTPGLARRLALGRALLAQPQILLLADPFTGCEAASSAVLSRVVRQAAEAGAAVMVLAEDSTSLAALCEVIYQLDHGRIVNVVRPGDESQPSEFPFLIPAKPEGKVVLVNPADILCVVAQDDRAFLQTHDDLLPTQFTLAELERRLKPSGFFRAHRSYLVNLQHVKEVIPYTRDTFSLRLKDANNTEIPMSKAAAQELRGLLGY